MTSLVNIHKKQEYDVYIGRAGHGQSGEFGNPYNVREYGLEQCLVKYKAYFHRRLAEDVLFKKRVEGLRGQRLGCFCCPEHKCHGMIIIEYLDGIPVDEQWVIMQTKNSINIFD